MESNPSFNGFEPKVASLEGPPLKPMLTEPGVKYFLNQTLKQCHAFNEKHYNFLFNMGLFVSFLLILTSILFYKYKGKLTPEEMEQKEAIKQQYILSKIKNFKTAKLREQQQLITGLPHWDALDNC